MVTIDDTDDDEKEEEEEVFTEQDNAHGDQSLYAPTMHGIFVWIVSSVVLRNGRGRPGIAKLLKIWVTVRFVVVVKRVGRTDTGAEGTVDVLVIGTEVRKT